MGWSGLELTDTLLKPSFTILLPASFGLYIYSDLVSRLHVQIRLMGNFVPWLRGTIGALCFVCKEGLDDVNHFLWKCKAFGENFQSVWCNLFQKIDSSNPTVRGSKSWPGLAKLPSTKSKVSHRISILRYEMVSLAKL